MEDFQPQASRLRLAREMLGLTKQAIAERISVSPTTVASFEAGDPGSTRYIRQLAEALEQPLGFFYAPVPSDVDVRVAFRSLRSARQKVKGAVRSKAITAILNVDPVVDAKVFRHRAEWPDFSGLSPLNAAEAARSWLGLGHAPIPEDLLSLLEGVGLRTFWYNDASEATSGMSLWFKMQAYAFIKESDQSAQRDNWTLAHEFGHLLMHKNLSDIEADRGNNDEADEFARHFLLPQGEFVADVPGRLTLEALEGLKEKYRVSMAGCLRAMRTYDLLSESQYHFAFKRLTQRNMRRREPGDRPAQQSKDLTAFAMQVARESLSLDEFATDKLKIYSTLASELVPPLKAFSFFLAFKGDQS